MTMIDIKEEFIQIYRDNIKREGADKLLDYLCQSDFFLAPASARYHSSYDGGLAQHSINVYYCLADYMARPRVRNTYGLECSDETIAIVSLLHDLCKIGCYKAGVRNVKENGVWKQVPTYNFEDPMPYGHGEKSVYIINGYMRLSREEAFAIRYHMGYSSTEDPRNVSAAFEMFPLAFALHVADSEATYYVESDKYKKLKK